MSAAVGLGSAVSVCLAAARATPICARVTRTAQTRPGRQRLNAAASPPARNCIS
ncbi:hypothetical protein [Streptomyces sp. NPDC093591]|uniref:hypothetical protein n=1 Tax=Streptomyces sp. NPDC093591 TaxID=3366044 RepID=UPI0038199FDA